jgi:hypothetical protein
MGLQQQLDAFKASSRAPRRPGMVYEAKIEELRASFAPDRAIPIGDHTLNLTCRFCGEELACLAPCWSQDLWW